MKIIHTKKTTQGFTIVELLIATAVFGVVLLIVTTGIIKIGQSYYKGIVQNRTQETTRVISEDISRTIQLARGAKVTDPANPNRFCIGAVRYTYKLNSKVGDSGAIGLIAENVPLTNCNPSDPADVTERRQLLSENMRLLRFKVVADPSGQTQTWRVDIRVAYGDNELLTHYDTGTEDPPPRSPDTANCKSGVAGSSFCATAQLNTLVKKRLISE